MRKSDFTLPTLDDLFSTQADDFERDTITIKHIVTNAKIDGKCEIVCADRAKTKSSLRSLPLVSNIREKLLALREQQKENRRVCGNCYSKKYDGYVFVDAMGNIFNPKSATANFQQATGVERSAAHSLSRPQTQLRLTAFGERCASEANSGVAGSQRLYHHGEHLRPLGLQIQDHLGTGDGDRACATGGRRLQQPLEFDQCRGEQLIFSPENRKSCGLCPLGKN